LKEFAVKVNDDDGTAAASSGSEYPHKAACQLPIESSPRPVDAIVVSN